MIPSRWKLATYALVILIGCLIAAPNLFTRQQLAALPDWVPKQQVTLGLDLKGGSHLVLELDAAALEREQIDALLERTRDALRDARITANASRSTDAVTVQVADPKQRGEAERILRKLISIVSLSALTQSQPDLEVTTLPDGTITLKPTQAALIARRAAAVDRAWRSCAGGSTRAAWPSRPSRASVRAASCCSCLASRTRRRSARA
jgi:SecD/SecF fusion protein